MSSGLIFVDIVSELPVAGTVAGKMSWAPERVAVPDVVPVPQLPLVDVQFPATVMSAF